MQNFRNTILNKVKICTYCGNKLDIYNTSKYNLKEGIYTCKKCESQHQRQTEIGTTRNGKRVVLQGTKRPYPTNHKCEICHKIRKCYLHYHHWNDSNLLKGMWVCPCCHHLIEGCDRNLHKRYFSLKEKIDV